MSLNKRALHVLAALWILVFHLWIPLGGGRAEMFIVRIGYVGVDLFFFTSAYSLVDKVIDFGAFMKNRFGQIYVKFALFVILAAFYSGFSWLRCVKCLTGWELFSKGGGAFLWFLPAIMLFYALYPLFLKWPYKYKTVVILVLWAVFSLILDKGLGYHKIFIFTNRLPVILLGYALKKHKIDRRLSACLPFICVPVSLVLLHAFGFERRLQVPWQDTYLCLALVLTLGLASLSRFIPDGRVLKALSSATLEIYALQMIVGFDLATALYRLLHNKLLTNILVIVILWCGGTLIAHIYDRFKRLTQVLEKN